MSKKRGGGIIVTEFTVISKTYFIYTKHNITFGNATRHYGIVKLNRVCITKTANS